jgi:ubiquinol-cytochrome c reductase cytochrome c subunit
MAERRRHAAVVAAIAVLTVVMVASPVRAQVDGKTVYDNVCAACHQATGAGLPGLFPPLAGNPNVEDSEYLRTVIRNGLQGEITVLGQTYNGVMPAQSLTDEEVTAVIDYIQNELGSTPTTTTPSGGPATTLPEGEQAFLDAAARGEQLFLGSLDFSNGGTPCYACHTAGEYGNLSGPGLGPDLTDAFADLGGREALVQEVASAHGDVMAAVYADKPLTDLEAAQVAAFLEVASGDEANGFVDGLLVLGLAGLVALLAWVALFRAQREADEEEAAA